MLQRLFQRHALLRFLVVGALNTAVGYALYAGFILLGLHYSVAVACAMAVGVLFNFATIGKVVFRNLEGRRFVKFLLVYLIAYFLNVGLLKVAKIAGLGDLVAGAVVALPVALASFTLHRYWVFGNPGAEPEAPAA